jgi:hypothetical protein
MHAPCPFHGGVDGYSLFKDFEETGAGGCYTCGLHGSGVKHLAFANGWTEKQAVFHIYQWLDNQNFQPCKINTRTSIANENRNKILNANQSKAYWLKIWEAAHTEHHLMDQYFSSRGITCLKGNPALRLHERLKLNSEDGQCIGYYPCILAAVRSKTHLVGFHCTYLTPHGRIKQLTSAISESGYSGAAFHISNPDGSLLGICEGIETGASVLQATGMPVWSGLTTTIMMSIQIPESIQKVVIWADHDPAGLEYANTAKLRLENEGKEVSIKVPPNPGEDWNDVYVSGNQNLFI